MSFISDFIMVRNYKRKTLSVNEESIKKAIEEVLDHGNKLRKTLEKSYVKHITLFYRIKQEPKKRKALENNEIFKNYEEYSSLQSTAQVFCNYERALRSQNFTGDKIYNLDETGITTATTVHA